MDISTRLKYRDSGREGKIYFYRRPDGRYGVADENGEPIGVSFSRSDITSITLPVFDETPEKVRDVVSEMVERLNEAEAQGIEVTVGKDEEDVITESENPASINDENYSARDIYVENKPFSVRQLQLLIDDGDLELNPDFQRNFIWDRTRQSLLIESMLLGLPLPSIYLSQYDDGRLTVVDGLQRITTMRRFLRDELRLTGLEYLRECEGKTFSELKGVLSDLQIRQFNQIQIGCFVIDYRSPDRLKFDLFRRLNTGSKPLNRSEIRNCLTRSEVQRDLKLMWNSEAFRLATGGLVSNLRMQATDLVMRYLFFRRSWLSGNFLVGYRGEIDDDLDAFTSTLNRGGISDEEIYAFDKAMLMARYLFRDNAFRKRPSAWTGRRHPVNQLLFEAVSVILSTKRPEEVYDRFAEGSMAQRLYSLIDRDNALRSAISTGTNGRRNVYTAFLAVDSLF